MNFKKPRGKKNSMTYASDIEKWRKPHSLRKSLVNYDEPDEEQVEEEETIDNTEPIDWATEFFGRSSIQSDDANDQDVEVNLSRKQTLILSTLLPDEILLLDKFETDEPRRFVGVLLMADVSGYTALSERYNNSGKGGTYRLTVTLNTYLGALIEIIYSHGGDIIKFAGDAFLALWKTDKKTYLYNTIHTVIACALLIQHLYGKYETDVKVNLKVKLAISAGNLLFSTIGVGNDMNFVLLGLPVLEAKLAESVCASGEVKLTPTAWAHCFSRNYDHQISEDGHVTIKSILYDPHDKDVSRPFIGLASIMRQINRTYAAIENMPDSFWLPAEKITYADSMKKEDALGLRKAVLTAEGSNYGSQLRKFIIRPVLTQIDAHQPLEYLTEMRQVSILFLTLKPRECPPLQLISIVNNSYQITCEIVLKSMGCVNKIILFDKDVMTLVIFGLRGFKHESEAQAALKCACSIKKSISALDGVTEVSIGVTTGQVYCGVVGHPLRREFTVIGAIVNKAARLMCSFRNKITCDETTFIKSKMSKNGFTLQPKIELKGIGQSGKIYEYTEEIRTTSFQDISMILPLLDRTDEMEYFEKWFDVTANSTTKREFDALLLIGESRIGKSRLLEWFARSARNKSCNVTYLNLTSIHSANPYLALGQIINQLLGLEEPIVGFNKEEKIIDIMKAYDDNLCYLNNIIKVRFAYYEGLHTISEEVRLQKSKRMFKKFISSLKDTHLIFLDDLQNLDASSWEFISIMLNSLNIYTVLTVNRAKFSDVHKWLYTVFISDNIRKIMLGPLSSVWIPPLACQILDVDAVPNDLVLALKLKCKGLPGLVESFIVHLFSTGAIELMKVTKEEVNEFEEENFNFPDRSLIKAQAFDSKEQELLGELMENEKTDEVRLCTITDKKELNTNINVQHADVIIMIQIDALTPYQQLLLKISSVIGNVISRDLLEAIMYENNSLTTAKAIKRLFAMRIFTCANLNTRNRRATLLSHHSASASTSTLLACDCRFEYSPEDFDNLPKYAYCKVMKFKNKDVRSTCYELLPMNQKKEFHSRIVNYLENTPHKCTNCGGGIILVQSFTSAPRTEIEFIDQVPLTVKQMVQRDSIDSESSTEKDDTLDELPIRFSIVNRRISLPNRLTGNKVEDKENESIRHSSSDDNVSNRHYDIRTDARKSMPTLKLSAEDNCEKAETCSMVTQRTLTLSSILYKDFQADAVDVNIFEMLRPVLEAETIDDWRALGVEDSQDDLCNLNDVECVKSFNVHLEKGVSSTDFNKCTCTDLNLTIHEQLVYHAKQAELTKKAVEFLLHYSYLNVIVNNSSTALDCLEEVEKMCRGNQITHVLTSYEIKRSLARTLALRAAAYFLSDRILAAKIEIDRAIHAYGHNIHNFTEMLKFKKILSIVQYKSRERRFHEELMKSDSLFCFNFATILYCAAGDEKLARICCYKALRILQKYRCNIIDTCEALTIALNLEIDRGYPENTLDIEVIVTQMLRDLPRPVRASEMYVVGKLLMAIFRSRICRANLTAAIRSGFRAIVVSHFLHANVITLDVIPDLFFALLSRRRIGEAVDILRLTMLIGHDQDSFVYETWYYALSMELILDAGMQIEAPHDIQRFCEYTISRNISANSPGRRRLVVNMWTYWLRADNERKAKKYENEALSWAETVEGTITLTTLLSGLRLAEGMHECLVRKVDDLRKVVDMMELRSIADRELSRLEKDVRLMRTAYPRWLILRGYSNALSGRHVTANSLFLQAIEEARRNHSHLSEAIARAALSNSRIWVLSARNGHFIDWQSGIERANESWSQLLYKVTPTARHR